LMTVPHFTHETLERGFEVDRLTDARRPCPIGAGSNLYPVCGGFRR
jgi:hypothetical protein